MKQRLGLYILRLRRLSNYWVVVAVGQSSEKRFIHLGQSCIWVMFNIIIVISETDVAVVVVVWGHSLVSGTVSSSYTIIVRPQQNSQFASCSCVRLHETQQLIRTEIRCTKIHFFFSIIIATTKLKIGSVYQIHERKKWWQPMDSVILKMFNLR